MRSVLVDAFDSFIFVIKQYLSGLDANPTVIRSAENNVERVRELDPDFIVLGPGPGHPFASGHIELVDAFKGSLPILGVCLGHQAIACSFGATVSPAAHIMHGKTSLIDHDGRGVFTDTPKSQQVVRYHSLIVDEATLPPDLEVTARSRDDGYIMGLRHVSMAIESVQFHPEGIMTSDGIKMLRSFICTYVL